MNTFLFDDERKNVYEEYQAQMGASIENQHLLAGILNQLEEQDTTEIIKKKVTEIKPASSSAELPVVTLDDGTLIQPKLLIGSDGENSMTRQSYGI
jgi:2-polyprenyl-6-methoxyphenol hydroxylase-like FAD-dependent oxidoreductase